MNRDDRMTQVSNEYAPGDPIVQYVYDAMGRRIMRKKGSEWRMFYYDGLSVAAEKKSTNSGGSWAWDALYTLVPGVIGHVLAKNQWYGSGWATTFLHYDHIGNVTLSTDASGDLISYYDQDAFGNPLEGPSTGLRLQTKELDADAGLYYFYQRWMDLISSGFISQDRIGTQLYSSYSFNYNNSMKSIDPGGSLSWDYGWLHSCNSTEKIGIEYSMKFIEDLISNPNSCLGPKARKALQEGSVKINCRDYDKQCGEAVNTNKKKKKGKFYVDMGNKVGSGGCPCLPALLLHEILHAVAGFDEEEAEGCENLCFGVCATQDEYTPCHPYCP